MEITDKFGKASSDTNYALATTVKTARTIGESVLACFDLSKFSTTTPVFFVTYKKTTDPVTGDVTVTNQVSWKALVNPDNNTLTNLTLAPGYEDIGNDIGDFVECIPTSFWANELIGGIRNFANDDATLKSGAVRTALELTFMPSEVIADFIADGGVLAIDSGLTGSFSDVVYYIAGVRYEKTGIANKAYTPTKDTYVFIDDVGAVTYSEVAVNAAAPAAPADSVLVGMVTTGASAITSIRLRSRGSIGYDEINKAPQNNATADNQMAVGVAPRSFTGFQGTGITAGGNNWGFTKLTALSKTFNNLEIGRRYVAIFQLQLVRNNVANFGAGLCMRVGGSQIAFSEFNNTATANQAAPHAIMGVFMATAASMEVEIGARVQNGTTGEYYGGWTMTLI